MMIANVKKSRLPAGYQEVEYLQATGTQYIDTGFGPNQNTSVELFASFEANNRSYFIFGTRKNMKQCFSCALASTAYTRVIRFDYNNNRSDLLGFMETVPTLDSWYKIEQNKNESYIDNNLCGTFSYSSFNADSNLLLFAINSDRTATGFAEAKEKDIKILNNGVLARYFIPCYRKSDNKPGMYDLAGSICPLTNSPFYINAGTGEFTVGPNI